MRRLPAFCRGEVVKGFGRGSKELGIPTGERGARGDRPAAGRGGGDASREGPPARCSVLGAGCSARRSRARPAPPPPRGAGGPQRVVPVPGPRRGWSAAAGETPGAGGLPQQPAPLGPAERRRAALPPPPRRRGRGGRPRCRGEEGGEAPRRAGTAGGAEAAPRCGQASLVLGIGSACSALAFF